MLLTEVPPAGFPVVFLQKTKFTKIQIASRCSVEHSNRESACTYLGAKCQNRMG